MFTQQSLNLCLFSVLDYCCWEKKFKCLSVFYWQYSVLTVSALTNALHQHLAGIQNSGFISPGSPIPDCGCICSSLSD